MKEINTTGIRCSKCNALAIVICPDCGYIKQREKKMEVEKNEIHLRD